MLLCWVAATAEKTLYTRDYLIAANDLHVLLSSPLILITPAFPRFLPFPLSQVKSSLFPPPVF